MPVRTWPYYRVAAQVGQRRRAIVTLARMTSERVPKQRAKGITVDLSGGGGGGGASLPSHAQRLVSV